VVGSRSDPMRERRFFVTSLDASIVELDEKESHHATAVLRLAPGDEISLFDGRGRAHRCRILEMTGPRVQVEVGTALPSRESPIRLSLAVAVPKGDTMSLIVHKLTELGVSSIRPIVAERTESTQAAIAKRLERWQRIALEAAKQCARSKVPDVPPPVSLEELLDTDRNQTFWLAHPDAPPLEPERIDGDEPLTVLVGPEGGWSPRELELAEAASVERFALGPRTLRVETAVIAATSLFQWLAGDLGERRAE
jgi:16S rRNA (uracil1498-N3)-methyltransferase